MKKSRKSLVRRITVDEKLSDNLIRVLISGLAAGIKEFNVNKGKWQNEKEVFITPQNYTEKLGMSKSMEKKLPWEDLKEGQAFLYGNFEIKGSRKSPAIVIHKGPLRILRIDNLIRSEVEELYSAVLRQGG